MNCYSTFASKHGTRQGDALSPLLFVVYREAVQRDLCHLLFLMRERNTIFFADDADFIHHDLTRLEQILLVAEKIFRIWSMTINVSKLSELILLAHRTLPTNAAAPSASCDRYWATPKTSSSKNLTHPYLPPKHYAPAYTMSMCYLLCYMGSQTAKLVGLKRITAVTFAASSVSSILSTFVEAL